MSAQYPFMSIAVATLLGLASAASTQAQSKPVANATKSVKVAHFKRSASASRRALVPAGRDAFLPYQVTSTDELVSELSANLALRQRYARHFGIQENKVVDFVKNALIVYRMPEARQVTTYGVTKSGMIYPVTTRLKKGERVWATRSGLPVLRWACANPLTKNLPGTLLADKPKPATKKRISLNPRTAPAPAPVLAEAGSPAMGIEASPELSTPGPIAVDTAALLPIPALTGGGTTSGPMAGPSVPNGSVGPGFLPLLLPIAGIIVGNPGGGGSNSPVPPGVTDTRPAPKPSPTPTPGGEVVPVPSPTPEVPSGVITPIPLPTPEATPGPEITPPGEIIPVPTPPPGAEVLPSAPGPAIPEPGTWGLIVVGGLGLFGLRRKK